MFLSRWRALIALAVGAMAQTAAAAIVSGSFSGIASDGLLFGTGPATPTFEGAQVQGSFRVDTLLLGPQTLEDPENASYRLTGDALLLRFTVGGTTYSFGNQGLVSVATVFTGQGGQTVLFGANFIDNSAPSALLWFGDDLPAGASGLYVDGLDLTSLHPAPVLPGFFSRAGFQLSADVGAVMTLITLRFDDPAAVPEPATWALLLAGLALARWRRMAAL